MRKNVSDSVSYPAKTRISFFIQTDLSEHLLATEKYTGSLDIRNAFTWKIDQTVMRKQIIIFFDPHVPSDS